MKLASLWVFVTSLLIVTSSRLVFFYSTVAEPTQSTSVISFLGLSIAIDPIALFVAMYVLSPKVSIENTYVRMSVALLTAGLMGEGVAEWLSDVLFQSGLGLATSPTEFVVYVGFYTFAVGFSAGALSYFRRTTRVGTVTASAIDEEEMKSVRGRLLDFATFAFGIASIAIAVKLATFIGQTVVLDPINYGDSIIIVIAALLLIYRLR